MEGTIRRHSIWVAAALLLALAMRLFALALAGDAIHFGDPRNYVRLATALADGRGMVLPNAAGNWVPTGMFPPGLPLLLAAVALVLPLNSTVLCVVNTLIDSSAALLLGRLAMQLGRRDLSVPLALAYLLWPSIAFMAPLAYKEGLIIALLLAALVALIEQAGRPGFRWAALSGLAAGALILTQPGLAPLIPMIFLLLAKRFGGMSRWLAVSACAAGVALLLMVPWWIRNAMIFGQFVPLTTSAGLALWVGADPSSGMVWKAPLAEWANAGEVQAARLAADEAWRTIAADPAGYISRCLAKFPRSFFTTNWAIDQLILAPDAPRPELAQSIRLRAVPTLAELSVALAALAGLFRFRKSAAAMLLLACIAQVMIFSIWFEFSERHRLFMTPFLLLLAGMMLAGQEKRPGMPAE